MRAISARIGHSCEAINSYLKDRDALQQEQFKGKASKAWCDCWQTSHSHCMCKPGLAQCPTGQDDRGKCVTHHHLALPQEEEHSEEEEAATASSIGPSQSHEARICTLAPDDEWQSVVFSDKKKQSLSGPDGSQRHCHDLDLSEEIACASRGGRVTV